MRPIVATWLGGPHDGQQMAVHGDYVFAVLPVGEPPAFDYDEGTFTSPTLRPGFYYQRMSFPVRRRVDSDGREGYVIVWSEATKP